MGKERFSSIQERHALTTERLAREADTPQVIVTDMQTGIPVSRSEATQVLETLSKLTGNAYSLDTVEVAVKQDTPFQSEVARMLAEIDEQTEAMLRGLTGLSQGSSRHEIIHAKWQAMIAPYEHRLEQANQTNP